MLNILQIYLSICFHCGRNVMPVFTQNLMGNDCEVYKIFFVFKVLKKFKIDEVKVCVCVCP